VKYVCRTTQLTITPENEPTFDERATSITITDEAGGEFVVVEQESGRISIAPEEWPVLRDAIDRLIADCRDFGEPE
jgi:hypothetical protein